MSEKSVVQAVKVGDPLAPYAQKFADELRRRGYTELSAAGHLRLMAHVSRWLCERGLDAAEFTPERAEAFSVDRAAAGYRGLRTVRALRPLEEFLQAEGALVIPVRKEPQSADEQLLARYRVFLEGERGVVEKVSVRWRQAAAAFLAEHPGFAEGAVSIDAADVSAFCVRELPRRGASAAQNLAAQLRTFLRFCHVCGLLDAPLAQAIPPVARRAYTSVPRGISADALARLLASCDRDEARGRRDRAILLLLARLGLRAGEVARLSLEDIDWHLGELVVNGKGNRVEKMPLPADVGEAVAGYLTDGRRPTAASRAVFLRAIAPWEPLSAPGVTWVVYDACRRAGVEQVGAHRLRHTLASEALAAGASYSEVGQLLRHASVASTQIYAKVDFASLRPLAQIWPGGAR